MLKFIQKWLHNNVLKKYGFGWLYRDFLTFPNTFDRWLVYLRKLWFFYFFLFHKKKKLRLLSVFFLKWWIFWKWCFCLLFLISLIHSVIFLLICTIIKYLCIYRYRILNKKSCVCVTICIKSKKYIKYIPVSKNVQ